MLNWGLGLAFVEKTNFTPLETNGQAELVDAEKSVKSFTAATKDEVGEKTDDQFGIVFNMIKKNFLKSHQWGGCQTIEQKS